MVTPEKVRVGETVTITADVANTGEAEGSYSVVLKINGVVEATKEITVNAGFSKEVTFIISKDVAGTYSVEVDGLTGSFTVKPVVPKPINWAVIVWTFDAIMVLVYFLVVRRRGVAKEQG